MLIYFFPIFAAVLYGLNYAVMGRVFETYSLATYVFYSTVIGLFCAAAFVLINKDTLSIVQPFRDRNFTLMMVVAVLAAWGGWFFTILAIKNVSPTFAAIAEVCYPVFVPLFAYLLFREKQWDMPTLIGGAFIFTGLAIIIHDKIKS